MTWQSISRRGNAPSYVRTAGFTLVEMLLALAILGLLSVLLFGGFRFGLRAWEVGDRRLDRADEIVVVQNFLRRELSQIIAIPQGLGQPLAFWGEPKSVMFLAPLPERGNLGGIYALKIASAPAGSDEAPLVMAWQLFRPDMDLSQGMAPGQTYPLLTGVESISFSYYGRRAVDAPAEWQDRWAGFMTLPELIRVTVQFQPKLGRRWPPLTVALKLRGLG